MPSATREIYRHILSHIPDGRLDVGDHPLTEDELAEQFRTSRTNACKTRQVKIGSGS